MNTGTFGEPVDPTIRILTPKNFIPEHVNAVAAALEQQFHLAIEHSFFLTFLFVLLLFSNLWTVINRKLLLVVASTFPHLMFYRHEADRMHWLRQTLVGGLIQNGLELVVDDFTGGEGLVQSQIAHQVP